MARARKSSLDGKPRTENSVASLEIEFDSVREKLPAEYEKAITGAERTLSSHLKKLNTLKGRLEKARERLAKAREQKIIKATAAVQARFEKAQAAVAAAKTEITELRAEITELRKGAGELKKRLRKFNFIEKEIQKVERKAVKPRKYRRRKKSRISASTGADGGREPITGKAAASKPAKGPALLEQETGIESPA